ncbi:hypothetical protein KKI24_08915 [bacterium]|nr:hypothetical protein [bacterium]
METNTLNPEKILADDLPQISQIVDMVASKRGLQQEEAEEFRSVVYEKMVSDDYRIIRRFRGPKISKSYYILVINNLFNDHYRSRHGRWRPSVKAREIGKIGILLDELLHKKNLSFEDAYETIVTRHLNLNEALPTRFALEQIATQLKTKVKPSLSLPGDDVLKNLGPTEATADQHIYHQELLEKKTKIDKIIKKLGQELSPEEQLIFKWYFEDNHSITGIARLLGQKRQRVEKLLQARLREFKEALQRQGIEQEEGMEVIQHFDNL